MSYGLLYTNYSCSQVQTMMLSRTTATRSSTRGLGISVGKLVSECQVCLTRGGLPTIYNSY